MAQITRLETPTEAQIAELERRIRWYERSHRALQENLENARSEIAVLTIQNDALRQQLNGIHGI